MSDHFKSILAVYLSITIKQAEAKAEAKK